jgi:cation:H+ antiporter
MLLQFAILAAGVAILAFGADLFVRGASSLALRFGISQLVVGLIIVGFGTSTPELAVNLKAALSGSTDIAIGNVVGSNIANVGIILGLAAVVAPLAVHLRLVKVELPLMIAISFALWAFAWYGGVIGRVDGAIMFAVFIAFLLFLLRSSRSETKDVQEEYAEESAPARSVPITIGLILVGLAMLMGGANLCVDAAVALARMWGMSELLIGLTIVAIGTSLPELASSVAAAYRGNADIAIGNVIGSNIYNILFILGLTAMISPLPANGETLLWFDLPVMVAFALVLVPMVLMGMRISRTNGIVLLAGYAAYVGYHIHLAGGA